MDVQTKPRPHCRQLSVGGAATRSVEAADAEAAADAKRRSVGGVTGIEMA